MSTTLQAAMQELSKQMGDSWQGTLTTIGAADGTTLIDTGLKAKANDWVTLETYDLLTSGTYSGEERKVSTLDNSTGTLTMLAHTGQVASAVTYEVHRLFTASEKRRALVYAARHSYPNLFNQIRDESVVSGNWFKDGSFEKWTSSTSPTYWAVTTVTATQITTPAGAYIHGPTSCKLSGSAGYIAQGISQWEDLKNLGGKSVTFTCRGHCDTASSLRLGFYDGATVTYSDYHAGDSAWTVDNDPMTLTVTVPADADSISFRIYRDTASGTAYVDDARLISGARGKVWIGAMGLAQNKPHQVLIEQSNYSYAEPWILLHNWHATEDGYLYLPDGVSTNLRLRVLGIGVLDFLASGVSSTAWTATIAIDSPQLDLLVAEAALYLCKQMIVPNYSTGDSTRWQQAYGFWKSELAELRAKYSMKSPAPTVHWE